MIVQKVSSVIQTHIVGVSRSTKIAAAMKVMERSAVPALPILHGSTLVGTVTRVEIEKAIRAGREIETTTIDKIMKKNFKFVEADDSIDEAGKLMIKYHLPRIPVVNNSDEMHCIGMVSSTEILNAKNKRK
ncbi:MAG: CBS domain-containing protein [Candidatus Micrarchaeales archaeon]